MKKLMLIGLMVVGTVTFSRDYDYQEKQIHKQLNEIGMLNREGAYEGKGESALETYEEFHRELERMERGGDSR